MSTPDEQIESALNLLLAIYEHEGLSDDERHAISITRNILHDVLDEWV